MAIAMKALLALCAAALLAAAPARAQQDIGVAAVAVKEVRGTLAAAERRLVTGDRIHREEVVATGAASRTQLLFSDSTTLTVGPNSSVVLDSYVYDPAGGAGKLVLDATQGAFRFVSGSMRHEAYEIRTPAATIGVRGTIIDLLVLPGRVIALLRQGAMVVFDLQGRAVTVTKPGDATVIVEDGGPPSEPGPLPPSLQQFFDALGGGGGGTGLVDPAQLIGLPVPWDDLQELAAPRPAADPPVTGGNDGGKSHDN